MKHTVAPSDRRTKIFYGTARIQVMAKTARPACLEPSFRGWARRGRWPVLRQTSAHSIRARGWRPSTSRPDICTQSFLTPRNDESWQRGPGPYMPPFFAHGIIRHFPRWPVPFPV